MGTTGLPALRTGSSSRGASTSEYYGQYMRAVQNSRILSAESTPRPNSGYVDTNGYTRLEDGRILRYEITTNTQDPNSISVDFEGGAVPSGNGDQVVQADYSGWRRRITGPDGQTYPDGRDDGSMMTVHTPAGSEARSIFSLGTLRFDPVRDPNTNQDVSATQLADEAIFGDDGFVERALRQAR